VALAVFWASLGLVLYTVALYPALMALLGLLARSRRRRPRGDVERGGATPPTVSLIIAASNEERYLGRMLEQVGLLDYPADRLEVVVASDTGSTDRTHAIAREHEALGGGARLCLPPPGEVGKNVSLDAAIGATRGEILVFADATALWRPDAVRRLAAAFADPRVGCVSAWKAYWLEDGFGPSSYRGYWRVEGLVDAGSSALGYVPNASGGLHALRRSLYRRVPNHMIHDLVDPAEAAGAGYLAIVDPGIPYLDAPWVGGREVWRARVRITVRALSSTAHILGLLLRGGRPLAAVQFVSHKLLRWLLWLPALGLLGSSLWLAPSSPAFALLAGAQLLLAALAALGLAAARAGRHATVLAHLGSWR
jgi:cellulose synthase/poly-beta-1,6-N-acetylglucosamine synthase-like glycosyltransferase